MRELRSALAVDGEGAQRLVLIKEGGLRLGAFRRRDRGGDVLS